MKKIYIAGKVTGEDRQKTVLKFGSAEIRIELNGFKATNPIDVVCNMSEDWQKAMKKCIAAMIECDAVLLLDDWTQSKGALIESQLALDLGIPRFTNINEIVKHFNENGATCNLQSKG